MQFLSFILIYPIIWILSNLPFRILYLISDIAYYIIYYVVGYRKKTVFGNLKLVFPEKSESEITTIAKKSYRHFTDIFIEMIKSFTISEKEIGKRYVCTNIEMFHKFEEQNQSILLLGAHYANWEWIFNFNPKVNFKGFAIYKKLKNRYFDKKVRETRAKYTTILVPTKEIFSVVKENTEANVLSLYGFLGDQSPRIDKINYWSTFLGIKTPAFTGVEALSKKYNLPIIFFKTRKIKRGYYKCTLELLTDQPTSFKDFDITDLFLKKVGEQIREAPAYYFWTHKRFKHKHQAN